MAQITFSFPSRIVSYFSLDGSSQVYFFVLLSTVELKKVFRILFGHKKDKCSFQFPSKNNALRHKKERKAMLCNILTGLPSISLFFLFLSQSSGALRFRQFN